MHDRALTFSLVLLLALAATLVSAQQLAYVPFAWTDGRPVSATNLGVDGGRTTWGLYDFPGDKTPGPATLVQGPVSATLRYVDAESSKTFSGDCVAGTPIAVCALNIDELEPPRVTLRGTGNAEVAMETSRAGVMNGSARRSRSTVVDGGSVWVSLVLGVLIAGQRLL